MKRGKLRVVIKGALGIKDDGKDNQMVVDFLPGFDADTGQVVDNNQKQRTKYIINRSVIW